MQWEWVVAIGKKPNDWNCLKLSLNDMKAKLNCSEVVRIDN